MAEGVLHIQIRQRSIGGKKRTVFISAGQLSNRPTECLAWPTLFSQSLLSDIEFSKAPYRQSSLIQEIRKVLVHCDNQCSADASPV